ncbi:MAG: alpha-amylase [Ignavibacteriaceae bacterium]|nr:alpha-amylase [Ignavibacteriaceae bacterium]
MNRPELIKYDLHISKYSRDKYKFEESLYSSVGAIIIASFRQARILSDKINKTREAEGKNDKPVTPGQLNAIGLMHELVHVVIRNYETIENPGVFVRSVKFLSEQLGEERFSKVISAFVEEFPPVPVYKGLIRPEDYIAGKTGDKSNKEILIEEIIILHLENLNPAFDSLKEMFDDKPLEVKSSYREFIKVTKEFFRLERPPGEFGVSLLDAFEQIILKNPYEIIEQLKAFRSFWDLIPDDFESKILSGSDLLYEDARLFTPPGGGKGTPPVPQFKLSQEEIDKILKSGRKKDEILYDDFELSYMIEEEKFTEDLHWMPNVVMIAKNTLVWLDQLSRTYARQIKTLDQIPDEELDRLAARNINSLWLIGIWERSKASRVIKQFCGNPDAASSAYSLYDYDIAQEIGGDHAYHNLRHRCALRGIRLASDMVPNHTGIYSRWIVDHPEYFISAPEPPYPSYSFTGPDLSEDKSVEIRLEDKYYTRQDAAVVFQHIDKRTGTVRYMYHGNDGTNMPWNDTAQLNYLDPVVREEVIQVIMNVARKFQIIRFDAAMVLAKKHIQRLWFPQPGMAGGVPSRADFAMPKEMFHRLLPKEFWREVVDRINEELPNTLLLAEAFWLMEGYFVRTLGMHRVYNSAFMHMFMKEENEKYKKVIKNTIEFDPEILKRYVNFMSNPDEETAINQFGKGDKYFGVCLMMITLPGLPMFAHGQVEGFTEKYGMEYKRAYYNETPDGYLIERHEREIFPLLKKRYIFSEAENFELYDLITPERHIDHNVFAFSNFEGDEKAVVFYNNSYYKTTGYIKFSSPKRIKSRYAKTEQQDIDWEKAFEEEKPVSASELEIKSLAQSLRFKRQPHYFYKFRDAISGLEYLRPGQLLADSGLSVTLKGYDYKVYMEFAEIYDVNGEYQKLYKIIGDNGVPSVELRLRQLLLEPLHNSVAELLSKRFITEIRQNTGLEEKQDPRFILSPDFLAKLGSTISEIEEYKKIKIDRKELVENLKAKFGLLRALNRAVINSEKNKLHVVAYDPGKGELYKNVLAIYFTLKEIFSYAMNGSYTGNVYEEFLLEQPAWIAILRLSDDYNSVKTEFDLLSILESGESLFKRRSRFYTDSLLTTDVKTGEALKPPTAMLLNHPRVKEFINYNLYQSVAYFSKERIELLIDWVYTLNLVSLSERSLARAVPVPLTEAQFDSVIRSDYFRAGFDGMKEYVQILYKLAEKSGFRLDEFITLILEENAKTTAPAPAEKPAKKGKKTAVKKAGVKTAGKVKAGMSAKKNNKENAEAVKAKKPVKKEKTASEKPAVKKKSAAKKTGKKTAEKTAAKAKGKK